MSNIGMATELGHVIQKSKISHKEAVMSIDTVLML